MTRLACMTLPYAEHSFERALEGIATAGYRYVSFGLWHCGHDVPDESNAQAAPELKALFTKYGLVPVQLIANAQFTPGESLERATQRIRLAQELAIPEIITCGTGSYKAFPDELLPESEYSRNHRDFVEHYQRIAQAAEGSGVTITIKPHTGNTGTAAEIMKTLAEIGAPNVLGCYDPGNVQFYEGIDAAQDFPQMAAKTFSIIAKDHRGERANPQFPIPGDGDVDFASIFTAWKNASGDGNVVVERADGDARDAEKIDHTMQQARLNLSSLLTEAGFTLE